MQYFLFFILVCLLGSYWYIGLLFAFIVCFIYLSKKQPRDFWGCKGLDFFKKASTLIVPSFVLAFIACVIALPFVLIIEYVPSNHGAEYYLPERIR